jgi:hypothetical protein
MAKRQSKRRSNKRNEHGVDDAIALLSADHRRVEELFAQWEGQSSKAEKQKLVKEVCDALIVHALLEEDVFYAACRERGVEDDSLDEAQVEHDAAKVLIADLQAMEHGSYHDAKVTVLKEYVKHHVAEEEHPRQGIFAKARAAGVDLVAVGTQLKERKQQLATLQAEGRLPQPSTKSFSVPPLNNTMGTSGDYDMARQDEQNRDDRGRFTADDDRGSGRGFSNRMDSGRGNGRGSSRNDDRERDEQGRFMSDDDRDDRSSRGRSSGRYDDRDDGRGSWSGNGRQRDGEGRFMSDDDRGYSRGRSDRDDYRSSSRDWDERGSARGRDDYYDDRERFRGGRDDDDRDRGRGGWFGDSGGHSEASRRGWEDRGGRSERGRDDDDRGRSRGGRDDDDRGRGWFGDSRGHAEAARRGWEERGDSGSRGRGRDDDDGRGRSRGGRDDEQGQGGWFGDPRGHAEAARRGWENRR